MKPMTFKIAENFFTLTETAAYLGVNRMTISRWIQSGRLEAQRLGGVAFIEKRVVEALKNAIDVRSLEYDN